MNLTLLSWNDPHNGLAPFAPELWLLAAIVGVLLIPFLVQRPNRPCGAIALGGILLALIALLSRNHAGDTGPHFSGMLVIDPLAIAWKTLLLIFSAGIVLMWFAASVNTMHEGDGPEFFTLLLGAILGMSLMGSTANLLLMVLAIETASMPSYVLAGFDKTRRGGAEAALKYVLFGAACSAVTIYSISLLFGLFGVLQIDGAGGIAQQLPHTAAGWPLIAAALVGLFMAIGFKIAAVPLHLWCPDVFEGASVDVAAFLSVASKGAGLVLLIRIVWLIAGAFGYASAAPLSEISIALGVVAALGMTIGNTAAFVQNNVQRLLAYSSIAQGGYILCGAVLLSGDSGAARQGCAALLFYLAVYLAMNLGAFTVTALVARNTGGHALSDFAGLGRRSPLLAACMMACLFSLIGLPPLAGFAAKLNIMLALARGGGWLWALLAIVGLNTVFSLYYYLRIARQMYLRDSRLPAFSPGPLGRLLSFACAASLAILLIGAGPLARWARDGAQIYFSPGSDGAALLVPQNAAPAGGTSSGDAPIAQAVR